MGCIYEDSGFGENAGRCSLTDEDVNHPANPEGQENGVCVCSDDPDPGNTCQGYESDWTCNECGKDMNIEECTCEDEL